MKLLVLMVTLTGNAQAISISPSDQRALFYVILGSSNDLNRFPSTQLPMYTILDGGLLTGADQKDQQSLSEVGLRFQVVDPDLRTGVCYLAETRPSCPTPDFASYGLVLLNASNGVLVRMDPLQVDALTKVGSELRVITLTPKPLPTEQSEGVFPDIVDPEPLIQGMIDQVTETQVYTYNRQLAGELPIWVDGD